MLRHRMCQMTLASLTLRQVRGDRIPQLKVYAEQALIPATLLKWPRWPWGRRRCCTLDGLDA